MQTAWPGPKQRSFASGGDVSGFLGKKKDKSVAKHKTLYAKNPVNSRTSMLQIFQNNFCKSWFWSFTSKWSQGARCWGFLSLVLTGRSCRFGRLWTLRSSSQGSLTGCRSGVPQRPKTLEIYEITPTKPMRLWKHRGKKKWNHGYKVTLDGFIHFQSFSPVIPVLETQSSPCGRRFPGQCPWPTAPPW